MKKNPLTMMDHANELAAVNINLQHQLAVVTKEREILLNQNNTLAAEERMLTTENEAMRADIRKWCAYHRKIADRIEWTDELCSKCWLNKWRQPAPTAPNEEEEEGCKLGCEPDGIVG